MKVAKRVDIVPGVARDDRGRHVVRFTVFDADGRRCGVQDMTLLQAMELAGGIIRTVMGLVRATGGRS